MIAWHKHILCRIIPIVREDQRAGRAVTGVRAIRFNGLHVDIRISRGFVAMNHNLVAAV